MNQGLLEALAPPVNRTGLRRAPEAWRAAALCRDIDPDVFYPLGRGRSAFEEAEAAKEICRQCPSREPCLRYALASGEDLGVWGGTSPEDRREIIRAQYRSVAS